MGRRSVGGQDFQLGGALPQSGEGPANCRNSWCRKRGSERWLVGAQAEAEAWMLVMPTGLGCALEAEGVGGRWILCGQWPIVVSVPLFGWLLWGERSHLLQMGSGFGSSQVPEASGWGEACLPKVGVKRDYTWVAPWSCLVSKFAFWDLLYNSNLFPIFFKASGGNIAVAGFSSPRFWAINYKWSQFTLIFQNSPTSHCGFLPFTSWKVAYAHTLCFWNELLPLLS